MLAGLNKIYLIQVLFTTTRETQCKESLHIIVIITFKSQNVCFMHNYTSKKLPHLVESLIKVVYKETRAQQGDGSVFY